jgi:hypothetical protein
MASLSSQLSLASLQFASAFDAQRPTLAKFAACGSLTELHVVRDAFLLNLGSDLCPAEAAPVKEYVADKFMQAHKAGNVGSFQHTIMYAVHSPGWGLLMEALRTKAMVVGSDLDAIWGGLERGRMEWLRALSAAHVIKVNLKEALEKDGGTAGDVSDGMMVWMYSLALSIPELQLEAAAWAAAAHIEDKSQPLLGYEPDLWDARRAEWAPLDRGVQAAAERGGSSVQKDWAA